MLCTSTFSPTKGFSIFFLNGKGTFVGWCGLGGNGIGIVGGAESSSSPSSGDSDVGRFRFRGVKTMPRQVQSHDWRQWAAQAKQHQNAGHGCDTTSRVIPQCPTRTSTWSSRFKRGNNLVQQGSINYNKFEDQPEDRATSTYYLIASSNSLQNF